MGSDPIFQEYFSESYPVARERWLAAARARGARVEALPLAARAPDGSTLGIDIGWLGDSGPERVLVHSAGLHGVEGFAGSAIQLVLLERLPAPPTGAAVIFVHVLNPYGMAWLRRANENHVDLNRNFIEAHAPRPQTSEAYRRLDPLLNPRSPPSHDAFLLRAGLVALRYGMAPLRQAIAQGQYEFPHGLFYGGTATEPGPRAYMEWIGTKLWSVSTLSAIDVHTGLGRWGEESIFSDAQSPDPAVGYTVHGGYGSAFAALRPATSVSVFTQEFGTYPALRVLHALREENRAHHYSAAGVDHPAKRRLLEMFAPRARQWRERGVAPGGGLVARF